MATVDHFLKFFKPVAAEVERSIFAGHGASASASVLSLEVEFIEGRWSFGVNIVCLDKSLIAFQGRLLLIFDCIGVNSFSSGDLRRSDGRFSKVVLSV